MSPDHSGGRLCKRRRKKIILLYHITWQPCVNFHPRMWKHGKCSRMLNLPLPLLSWRSVELPLFRRNTIGCFFSKYILVQKKFHWISCAFLLLLWSLTGLTKSLLLGNVFEGVFGNHHFSWCKAEPEDCFAIAPAHVILSSNTKCMARALV